jgi:anti-anti-sigma factor
MAPTLIRRTASLTSGVAGSPGSLTGGHVPTIIELDGEIDIFTSPALRERLLRATYRSTTLLICDLSRVSFCDACGLAVLVGIQRRARSMGITVGLAAPRPHVAELLRITGLDRSFTMYENVPNGQLGQREGTATWMRCAS